MKIMKTFARFKQLVLKTNFCFFLLASVIISYAKSPTGLKPEYVSVHPRSNGIVGKSFVSLLFNTPAIFSATLKNNRVELKITTENEINLSHIIIEKSMDGKNFKEAALVFTYGNTTSRSDYDFADNVSKINSGSLYYRLRSIDTDGATQYSDIHIIEITKENYNDKTALAYLNR
jgi:hypothetical protein